MSRLRATIAAGTTSLALLALNLVPSRGVVVTEEEWPGSWTVRYGWPSKACSAFGYDPGTGGCRSWYPDGLALNALVASVATSLAFLLALAVTARRRCP